MRGARRAVVVAIAAPVLLPGCGGAEPAPRQPTLPAAPAWVRAYCKKVPGPDRLLCPAALPARFTATGNEGALAPNRFGYVLEGDVGPRHWTIAADRQNRSVLDAYCRSRRVGDVRVRGARAQLRMASSDCGAFSDHLTLAWSENGAGYAVSAHHSADDSALARDLRLVAAAMRPAPR